MLAKGPVADIPDKSVHEYILQKCLEHGDSVAMTDDCKDGKSITFREIYDQSQRCAGFLRKLGIDKGDVVGLCSPSSTEYAVAFLGILACGATVNPVNPAFKEGEIMHLFKNLRPKAVFAHEGALETMRKVKERIPSLQNILLIGDDGSAGDEVTISWKNVMEFSGGLKSAFQINPKHDLALIPYSSGTTGLPKGVMLSHKNLHYSVIAFSSCFTWCENACVYCERPMYHMYGMLTLLSCLAYGCKLIVGKEYEVASLLPAIQKYEVSHIAVVPPTLIQIANAESVEKRVNGLKQALCGGDTVPSTVIETLSKKCSISVVHVYGMTEAGAPCVNKNTLEDSISVGSPTLGTEVKIIDPISSETLEKERKGEILIRGDQVMKGYLNDSEATAIALKKDGWLHTGDIGFFDKNGSLCIAGRMKDIIKYKAVQVSPSEVEDVISRHPKVADVGVTGIPHAVDGERAKAFVVKKDVTLTEENILELVRRELVYYKHLIGGVEFVDAIPKSATGKIQRRRLRELSGVQ